MNCLYINGPGPSKRRGWLLDALEHHEHAQQPQGLHEHGGRRAPHREDAEDERRDDHDPVEEVPAVAQVLRPVREHLERDLEQQDGADRDVGQVDHVLVRRERFFAHGDLHEHEHAIREHGHHEEELHVELAHELANAQSQPLGWPQISHAPIAYP